MTRWPLPLVLALVPALAGAHPLGNFTTNRFAALTVGDRALAVRYVVDIAELPTYRELQALDTDQSGTIEPAERDVYLTRAADELGQGLAVAVDGEPVTLAPAERLLEVDAGAGGLPTLRLEVGFRATLPVTGGTLEFHDRNYAGRPGWQEVIAIPGDGTALTDSSVPRTDRTKALRAYPPDQLAAPLQVAEARLTFAPGTGATPAPGEAVAGRAGASRFGDRMTELISTSAPLGPGLVFSSLLIAAVLGALHALTPGHGKTIVGAYLVGARGTGRHALVLGLVVTVTHTLGVYLLGFVTLTASHYVVPERVLPWISVVSGLIVLGIGASLALSRLGTALHGHAHGPLGHHHHDHDHDHGHDHGHTHLPPAGEPLSMRSLVALGVSGGLLPCPSALVVMLGAIAVGRVAFGLLLIVAFSAGLAAVLTGVGLALVYARDLFDRLPVDGRFGRYVPVASALVISAAGLAIVAQALAQIGV